MLIEVRKRLFRPVSEGQSNFATACHLEWRMRCNAAPQRLHRDRHTPLTRAAREAERR
jgi:hypothetical protein